LQRRLPRELTRGDGIVERPTETGETPRARFNGHAFGSGENLTPRPAPYVTDDAAIDAAAADIAALGERIASAIGTAKGHLSAADTEIAALRQQLAAAVGEIAVLKAHVAAADRDRAALHTALAEARGQASSLQTEAATLKREAAALKNEAVKIKGEAASWRTLLYKSERMLIDELDRLAQRAIAAAAPDPSADGAAPEVSIITPVYNRPDLLTLAVRSVLAQTFARWELIIIDDGSADDIAGAMRPFLADPRIRLVHRPHEGECATRNHGLSLARGEIVAYIDSDNFWYPDFLAAAAAVFRADPALEIAYGGIAYDWPNGDVRFYLLPFDRAALLRDNIADMNVIVHRRRAYERFGGFDRSLTRALEWDLMLRYTVERPAAQIPVMGARYRIMTKDTISQTRSLADNVFRIRRKWWARPATPPRVLVAVAEFPQASANRVHAEIACMRRFGATKEVWAPAAGASPLADDLAVHRGPLAAAIDAFRPDIVHVHGLGVLEAQRATLAAAGLPVTLRGGGTDAGPDAAKAIARALELPNFVRAYLLPGASALPPDERIRFAAPVFDSTLFAPTAEKDRRLVLRAAPGVPQSDLRFMLDLAKLLPEHRVVVAIARAGGHAGEIAALEAYRAEIGSPAELSIDLPRAELAALFAAAGIYVHSAEAGQPRAGGPVSIAEAMATGAYVVARRAQPFASVVDKAGGLYRDVADAAALVRATEKWTDADWHAAQNRSVERAFAQHADEIVLRPMFDDWCALVRERAAATSDAAQ
jgi:glycosyltransferase involved in cell wall biosynthesis